VVQKFVIADGRANDLNLEGRSVVLLSPSPFPDAKGQPQEERDWLITVRQRDGGLILMIFVAPEEDFTQ
jgi:hypothetical protein